MRGINEKLYRGIPEGYVEVLGYVARNQLGGRQQPFDVIFPLRTSSLPPLSLHPSSALTRPALGLSLPPISVCPAEALRKILVPLVYYREPVSLEAWFPG